MVPLLNISPPLMMLSVCILKNIRQSFPQFMDLYWTGLLKGLSVGIIVITPSKMWKGRCGNKSVRRRNVFAYLKIKKRLFFLFCVFFFFALVMSLFIAVKTKQFKWSFRSFDISLKWKIILAKKSILIFNQK